MKTTREITIKDRVFTVPDLMRWAGILDRQVSDAPESRVTTNYTVVFEDNYTIEGLAAEVFSDEELNRPSRPIKVEMSLSRRGKPDYIQVRLCAGDHSWAYDNSATIGGDDAHWVNANHTALLDALGKVPPQSFWWKRHRTLLLNLIALGVGNIMDCTIGIISVLTFRIWPGLLGSIPAPSPGSAFWAYGIVVKNFGPWLVVLFVCWLGFLPTAFSIRSWLLSMWPNIEFNFGSRYLRLENRRQKFNVFMALWVIPMIVAAVFEFAKSLIVK
jgi:hypothetical protein